MSTALGDRGTAVRRGVVIGAIGGVAGAVVMAMYAMVVSGFVKDVGFFTPLYHIASSLIAPDAMMTSMQEAGSGNEFSFSAGPALVGVLVHMVTGAVFGGIFGAGAVALRLAPPVAVAAGVVYGVVVLATTAFVALPIVAKLFGGGEPISKMPEMAGWGTFTVEHILYGLIVGTAVAVAARRPASVREETLAPTPA